MLDMVSEYPEGLEPIMTDMFGEGGAEEVREYYAEDWQGWNFEEYLKNKEATLEDFEDWFGFNKERIK